MPRPAKNLEGEVFGRLLVLFRVGTHESRYALWACGCECGGTAVAKSSDLTRGSKRSCGCLAAESARLATAARWASHAPDLSRRREVSNRAKRTYRDKHRTALRERARMQIVALSDVYVARLVGLPAKQIPRAIIEAKRAQLTIYRLARQLREKANEAVKDVP